MNQKLNYKVAFAKILESKLPFVLFSKPNQEEVYGYLQKDVNLWYVKDFEEDSGFVFSPFDTSQERILIKSDAKLSFDMSDAGLDLEFKSLNINDLFENQVQGPDIEIEKAKHINLLEKAIAELKDAKLKKVVVAREEKWTANKVDFASIFSDLVSNYPETFVYIWFHPLVGMWIGASPELFLEIDQDKIKSNSLAATKKIDENREWTDKEIEEQKIVSDFIENIYQQNMLFDIKKSQVSNLKAGNIEHLKTDITATLSEMSDLNYLINQLHPTPAVCGEPYDKSLEFIRKNEDFNRYFYTGFLGELNIDDHSELYVNLRCMQVVRDGVKFFVGGGITEKSDAALEWEETVNKSSVLKDVVLKHLK